MKKLETIEIGQRIKILRKNHGYTQEQFAEEIECSSRYVADMEQGRSNPSYYVLIKMCNKFNIGMDEIFSVYLNVKNKTNTDISAIGYNNLTKENKEVITHMIEYFNKQNMTKN